MCASGFIIHLFIHLSIHQLLTEQMTFATTKYIKLGLLNELFTRGLIKGVPRLLSWLNIQFLVSVQVMTSRL